MQSITFNPYNDKNICIGYQYDHNATKIVFDIDGDEQLYLKLSTGRDTYQAIPLESKEFIITSTYTEKPCYYKGQLFKKIDGELIANTPVFYLEVKPSLNNSEEIKEVVPPAFQTAYDNIVNATKEIEEKLANGEFNGEDGVGIKSIVKTGTEGLIDTYTITFTDDTTTTYQITNGRNGLEGVSILSVVKTSSEGLVDTYTISFSDGKQSTFQLTNGQNGTGVAEGGSDGQALVKDGEMGFKTRWVDIYTKDEIDNNIIPAVEKIQNNFTDLSNLVVFNSQINWTDDTMLYNTGYPTTNNSQSRCISDYIPCLPNSYISVSCELNNQYVAGVAFYDENEIVVKAISNVFENYTEYTTQVPTNAKYVRISSQMANKEDSYIKVNNACVTQIDTLKRLDELTKINIDEYVVTNYMLFVDIFENKWYNNEGVISNDSNNTRNATSLVKLDKTKNIYTNLGGSASVHFYDSDKNFILKYSGTFYSDTPILKESFPSNAEYVAFTYYRDSIPNGFDVAFLTKDNYREKHCGTSTKKLKNERPIINIYKTDSEIDIFKKLYDAFYTEDCDVYFEKGEYLFDSIWTYMYEELKTRDYFELPIGGNCRYFFNYATLTATQTDFDSKGYVGTVDLLSNMRKSGENFELYDGILIGKGIVYTVHDEGSSGDMFSIHKYRNMTIKYVSESQENTIRKCVGGGTSKFCVSDFENCVFETDYSLDLSFHGIDTSLSDEAEFTLIIRNCWLSNEIGLHSLAPNQTANLIYSGNSAKTTPVNSEAIAGTTWGVISWCNETRE